MAQWQSSLDSWLSSALLSSSRRRRLSPTRSPTTASLSRCCCPLTCSLCLRPRRRRLLRRRHRPSSNEKDTGCKRHDLVREQNTRFRKTHVVIVVVVVIIVVAGRVGIRGAFLLLVVLVFILILIVIVLLFLRVLWGQRDMLRSACRGLGGGRCRSGVFGTYRFLGLCFGASWFRRGSSFLGSRSGFSKGSHPALRHECRPEEERDQLTCELYSL